jgi:hypothetical protein
MMSANHQPPFSTNGNGHANGHANGHPQSPSKQEQAEAPPNDQAGAGCEICKSEPAPEAMNRVPFDSGTPSRPRRNGAVRTSSGVSSIAPQTILKRDYWTVGSFCSRLATACRRSI